MAFRGPSSGLFFKLVNGNPLPSPVLPTKSEQAVKQWVCQSQNFAGHSSRIGAATAAANAGIEDSAIQMLGRWNIAAFLSYILTPREHLARFSRALATTVSRQLT